MQSNHVTASAANGKEAAYFGVPWEDAYGYAQTIEVGDTRATTPMLSSFWRASGQRRATSSRRR